MSHECSHSEGGHQEHVSTVQYATLAFSMLEVKLNVKSLVTCKFPLERALKIFKKSIKDLSLSTSDIKHPGRVASDEKIPN